MPEGTYSRGVKYPDQVAPTTRSFFGSPRYKEEVFNVFEPKQLLNW